MNYQELKKKLSYLRTLVFFESIFPHHIRRFVLKTLLLTSVILFFVSSGILGIKSEAITGMFLVSFGILLLVFLPEAYFFSKFDSKENSLYDFELAQIVFASSSKDALSGLFYSNIGKTILLRAGLTPEAIKDMWSSRKFALDPNKITINGSDLFREYFKSLIELDDEFRRVLLVDNVRPEEFPEAAAWAVTLEREEVENERWWSDRKLKTIRPVGEDWSYGRAYALLAYSYPLRVNVDENSQFRLKESKEIELVLSKTKEANAIITGAEGAGKLEVLERLLLRVRRGEVSGPLKYKRFLIFDTSGFASINESKSKFEKELIAILNQASKAGNIILILPDLFQLISDGDALGSDVVGLLDPYLKSSNLQVVAVSGIETFHKNIEPNGKLMQRFTIISVEEGPLEETLGLMKKEVVAIERQTGRPFAYSAIVEACSSAEKYFPNKSKIDTATDLLSEVSPENTYLITRNDILSLVQSKTGIPTGIISEQEKEKLSNLSEVIHQRIVGQNEAVDAIADALARARSGIGNPNRPIGSFLFIGPTGVGKTETTKALAEIFFGDESSIIRLDMSEFNTFDSVAKLIGDSKTGEMGILANRLRENPYGVLLLDEFEKTDKKALDLFLQIIDEGIFSDARGNKVSARNTIIIATSNAGSNMIFDLVKTEEDISTYKDQIIEKIIKDEVFKPELLNRFDGVILFHPLKEKHLKLIVQKMIKKLEWRLKEKGIDLEANDELLDFLVKKGTDPKFGARELNRAIQDTLEKVIAKKIISGELSPGSTYVFNTSDLV